MKKPNETVVLEVLKRLSDRYPEHRTELHYANPFQLLTAVILSAQCTDIQVNQTTPRLFAQYPTAEALAKAKQPEIETLVKSCGFYRNKTKAIIACSQSLVDKFGGRVPQTLEELTSLRGVGRKTASVVLGQAFNVPAIAVDTHVNRVSNRLGWAHSDDPLKVEMELRKLIPMKHWSDINGLLILHGRYTCKARKPLCPSCVIEKLCPYEKKSTS